MGVVKGRVFEWGKKKYVKWGERILEERIWNEASRIVSDTVDELDDETLGALMGGDSGDIDMVAEALMTETLAILDEDKIMRLPDKTELMGLGGVATGLGESLRINHFEYFIVNVFDVRDVDVNWHHFQWAEAAQVHLRLGCLAARGHGKSVFWSNLFPIWKMYRYKAKEIGRSQGFLYLLSHTDGYASDLVMGIQRLVQEYAILHDRLYDAGYNKWTKKRIQCRNGAKLYSEGFWSVSRGPHPQVVIVDDPFKEDVAFSPIMREKSIQIFSNVVLGFVNNPTDQVVVVGTPFSDDDLYSWLQKDERASVWKVIKYPAVFPDGSMLWPGHIGPEVLEQKRKELGRLGFAREYLCRPVTSDATLFPYKLLKGAVAGMEQYRLVRNREAFPVKFQAMIGACDNAISSNVGADYNVYAVWGIDERANMWLVYVWRARGASFDEQIGKVKEMNLAFRPDVIVVEANAFQSIYTQFLGQSGIPIKAHTTIGEAKKDVRTGIPAMQVLFEQGKIKLPYGDEYSKEMVDVLFSELNNITFNKTTGRLESTRTNDDFVMNLWFAWLGKKDMIDYGFDYTFV